MKHLWLLLAFQIGLMPFAFADDCVWLKNRIIQSDTNLWCWESAKKFERVNLFSDDKMFTLELYKAANCPISELIKDYKANVEDGTVGECQTFTPKIKKN